MIESKLSLFAWGRGWSARLKHVLQHTILEPGDGFILDSGEVEHPAEMREVAAEGVTAQVGTILPLGGVWSTRPRISEVAVLDLAVEGEPLVHMLYYKYEVRYIIIPCNSYAEEQMDSHLLINLTFPILEGSSLGKRYWNVASCLV